MTDTTPLLLTGGEGANPPLVVTTERDDTDPSDGLVSLREAIATANATPGDDEITFVPLVRNIVLTDGLVIDAGEGGDNDLAITAPVDLAVTVSMDPDHPDTIMSVTGPTSGAPFGLTLHGLVLTGGLGGTGGAGGVYATNTNLTLDHVTVSNNGGGGVENRGGEVVVTSSRITGNLGAGLTLTGGSATVSYSTIDHNALSPYNAPTAQSNGGGIWAYKAADVTLINTTLANNVIGALNRPSDADVGGGGLALVGGGNATLLNCTVALNSAVAPAGTDTAGGGIYQSSDAGTLRIANSIVWGNTAAGPNYQVAANPSMVSNGHNVFGDSNMPGVKKSDAIGDARLGPLSDNGGAVPTMALLGRSPALDKGDAGDASKLKFDARGPGFARSEHGHVDAGAYEAQASLTDLPPLFTPGRDIVDLRNTDLADFTPAAASRAGAGDDLVHLSATQNLGKLFLAGSGDDVVFGASADDRIAGQAGDDQLRGGPGDDRLAGGAGDDQLRGGPGDDRLTGGAGADRLGADAGTDLLRGGAGPDLFAFGEAAVARHDPEAPHRILDFARSDGDRIGLAGIDADPDRLGDQRLTFIGTDPFTAMGQVRATAADGRTAVEVNLDHDPGAELTVALDGTHRLGAHDFLL